MGKPSLRLAALIGLSLAHCGPDKVAGGAGAGNPPLAEVSLAFKANSSADTALPKASGNALRKSGGVVIRNPDGTFTIRDSSGSAIELTSIEVSVSRVEFNLPEGLTCGDAIGTDCANDEISVTGSFTMDLMTGASSPALGKINLPQGLYKQVELAFRQDSGSAGSLPDTLFPNLILKGRIDSADGPVRPFTIRLNLREGLDFEKPEGFPIIAGTVNKIQIQLDVDGWLQGVDLTACLDTAGVLPDGSGTWNLSGDGFCGGEGFRLRRNVEASGAIDRDADEGVP